VEFRFLRVVLPAEHGRGMVGGDRLRRPARRREVAAVLRDPELVAEDRAGRRSAEADEYLRLDQAQLGFEPRTTGLELVRPWRLVDPALAALLELEVLDGVGDVDLLALEPRVGQGLVEHLAGRTDERRALAIFLVSRLFSDEHDPRGGRASAEDGLRGVTVEVAAGTARRCLAQLAERRAGGHEGRGALAIWCWLRGLLREERPQAPHAGIVGVLQEIAIPVGEPPQHV